MPGWEFDLPLPSRCWSEAERDVKPDGNVERAAMLSTLEDIAVWLVESGAFDSRGGP